MTPSHGEQELIAFVAVGIVVVVATVVLVAVGDVFVAAVVGVVEAEAAIVAILTSCPVSWSLELRMKQHPI